MGRAILDGSKTQTRRIAKHPLAQAAARINSYKGQSKFDCIFPDGTGGIIQCPYGIPGDRLWVRETWQQHLGSGGDSRFFTYKASDPEGCGPWRPSISMPRAASRILLEITDVRVQRLQAISEQDAQAEGVISEFRPALDPMGLCSNYRVAFRDLWNHINGPGAWDANPRVWAITFRRVAP
jgi:hypothetical protein